MSFTLGVGGNRTVQVDEPSRGQFASNLGGAVEYSFAHVIYRILETFGGALGAMGAGFLVQFLELMEPELVDYLAPLVDEILSWPGLPENLRNFFKGLRNPHGQAGAAILAGLGSAAGGTVVGSVIGTLLAPVTYGLNRTVLPARPNPAEAFAMLWRGLIDENVADGWMADVGWSDEAQRAFRSILRPRPSGPDLVEHSWRTTSNPEGARSELLRRGYTNDDIDIILRISEYLPGTGDLVRMAVREAWRNDVAAKYGYDEGFPEEFATEAARRGMSREWAIRYWRAHWDLPGPTMARDMLHRTDMTESDYETLLRIADYPPLFRRWMLETAYVPYTRVDVRRMYSAGILSETQVYQAHRDIGYDHEKAINLTAWTITEYQQANRDLTKADILMAYRERRMSRSASTTYLQDLGFDPTETALLLSREDYRAEAALETERKRTIRELYTHNQIDLPELHARLGALDLSSEEIETLVQRWTITRQSKIERMTVAQLKACYKAGIIDDNTARIELDGHGYASKYITWYMELWRSTE